MWSYTSTPQYVFVEWHSVKIQSSSRRGRCRSSLQPLCPHIHLNSACPSLAGGDDVQQLCDAGEEEFLEIMALVGMASKPLHVRRLQKALQEWVSNPGKSLNSASV
jgi:hypothetical protein